LASARRSAAGVRALALPQTAAGLQENVRWLKEQATTTP
jgi:hypothetical protein